MGEEAAVSSVNMSRDLFRDPVAEQWLHDEASPQQRVSYYDDVQC
jgi:hypothetical protein